MDRASVWGEISRAADERSGVEEILSAVSDAAVVLWRGGWDTRVVGDSAELRQIVQKLRNHRARQNVLRGLSDRMGAYGLQPVRASGQVVGALVLGEEKLEIAEPLAVLISQALANEDARSEQRNLMREVYRLRQQLRDATRVRTALLSQARHDLRTPLTAMKGYADMINRGMAGPVTPQLKRYVDRICAAVDKEVQLLEEKLQDPATH